MNEQIAEAKRLLMELVARVGKHDDNCPSGIFWSKNKHLPCNHPAWNSAPACNCIMSQVQSFLDKK